ncbi:MAG: replicative DNA helicase [Candidatus Neomarinimicrobiota bacterium]
MANKSQKTQLHKQPQALEAEQAVLGSMLTSNEAVPKAMQKLKANHFYKKAHTKIYSVMIQLFEANEPIDTVTVMDQLKKNKELESVGGMYYITGMVESVPTAANVEHYANIVLEKAILRKLIGVSGELSKEAYEDLRDVDEVLDHAEQSIFEISQFRLRGGFQHIDPILHETFERIDKIQSSEGEIIGIPSGITKLDDKTAGFQQGDLIVIAGRPSMGKTALALTIARNAAIDYKHGVGFFSLEMANHQLAMRMLCAEARLDNHAVRTGKVKKDEWKQLSLAVGDLAEAEIYLDDTPALTVLELRAKARRLLAEHKINLLIVDYLQLMTGPRRAENRQQEISIISRSLKALAKELNIPVVALSQLSRAVESRHPPIPQLSDLRESGAIEQDADVVMFLYRPWLYYTEEKKQDSFDDRGLAKLILSKQRNGPTGTIDVTFIERYARFENKANVEESELVPF